MRFIGVTIEALRIASRQHFSTRWLLLVAAAMISALGCGASQSTVEGTVTLDGAPVEGGPDMYGTVSFYPEGGSGAPAVGIIKSSGWYSVETGARKGLSPGKYLVAVSIQKIHPAATPEGLTRPERLSPPKYMKPAESGLTADVGPGNNTFNFDLVSDAGS